MTRILDGMQELRDGMGGLEAALAVMAPAMATKDDIAALTTAMEKMFKRLDDMEEKVQSLQHGWKVVPEGAAEGAAEDHEGEASGPVCAHSMDAGGATTVAGSSPKPKRTTRRGRGRRSRLLLDGDEGEANPAPAALGDSAASARDVGRDLADAPHARAREELKRATLGPPGPDAERVEGLYIAAGADARSA